MGNFRTVETLLSKTYIGTTLQVIKVWIMFHLILVLAKNLSDDENTLQSLIFLVEV